MQKKVTEYQKLKRAAKVEFIENTHSLSAWNRYLKDKTNKAQIQFNENRNVTQSDLTVKKMLEAFSAMDEKRGKEAKWLYLTDSEGNKRTKYSKGLIDNMLCFIGKNK